LIITGEYLNDEYLPVPLKSFKNEDFIFLKKENDTSIRALNLCKADGFTPNVSLYLDQQSTAFNIVCSGMGISFISDTLIKNMNARCNVVYYKLDSAQNTRQINFYKKKRKYNSYAIKEFLNLLSEETL
jgi:DNA-binding transcriptional LysR family regulator